jgi:hypothetical protein
LAVVFRVADGFFEAAVPLAVFSLDAVPVFFLWLDEVALSEDFAACSSYRFPSTGVTTSRAHNTAASSRAGVRIGRGEETELIISL